jgi:hypothetical protein
MATPVEDALRVFREKTQSIGLHFDAEGAAELIVDTKVSVLFTQIDDLSMELSVRLDCLSCPGDALMRRMLVANADCGESARFAVEPGGDSAILCRRVDVELFGADEFVDCVSDFIDKAIYWRGEAGEALKREPAPPR